MWSKASPILGIPLTLTHSCPEIPLTSIFWTFENNLVINPQLERYFNKSFFVSQLYFFRYFLKSAFVLGSVNTLDTICLETPNNHFQMLRNIFFPRKTSVRFMKEMNAWTCWTFSVSVADPFNWMFSLSVLVPIWLIGIPEADQSKLKNGL